MKLSRKLWLLGCLLAATPLYAQQANTTAWNEFDTNSNQNVLLDFSYAGYNHGLSLPDENHSGYTTYNVVDYGAVPNDGKSDREALKKIITAIGKKANARAIIYFPEGEFILHTAADDVDDAKIGKKKSVCLNLVMGQVILKGAGRDKTILTMDAPMLPANEKVLYSSPTLLSIRNNGTSNPETYAKVKGTAAKGTFKVTVDNASKLKVGQWVCLKMKPNKDEKVIKEELLGRNPESTMTNLTQSGVTVIDYHQIKSISGTDITFEEPIMRAVKSGEEWEVIEYKHHEGVGVEDLTFRGKAKPNFKHHGSWQDDGAYKPINFVRLVNSWMRRVRFENITECATFQDCANVICYDVEITGNRGHSAVRMAGSSRGLIANVYDNTHGYLTSDKNFADQRTGLGQYHACGISKHSIGNVIWNCTWGTDDCFESHATQPRASLFDCCKGGFMQLRMGGDKSQLPNHLDDLTLWNFDCTAINPAEMPFKWWEDGTNKWYKTLPPTIVGMHGTKVDFADNQTKRDEANGQEVSPRSLYAAQLKKRLGYLPAWVTELDAQAKEAKKTWDFTVMSTTDEDNLKQDTKWDDAANAGLNYYSNKQNIGSASGTKKPKFEEIKTYTTPLSANGKELEGMKGLHFGLYVNGVCKALGAGKFMICHDEAHRMLRLNARGIAIVIPNCKKGQTVVVHSKPTSRTAKNYFKTECNLDIKQGFAEPEDGALVQESIGTVKADGDVVLTSTNGLFLYDIILKDTAGKVIPTGLTKRFADNHKQQSGVPYNLQGQRVDRNYKGVVIQNGKKTIQK